MTWLQRHPLIYPIFSQFPEISAPLARGNLHLVTLFDERAQPLILRFQLLSRSLGYIGQDCTRFI